MRIDVPTLIPIIQGRGPERTVRVPVRDVTNAPNVCAPNALLDPDECMAHSSGLLCGLTAADRTDLLTGEFANTLAGKQITTMGLVLEAARRVAGQGDSDTPNVENLIDRLAGELQKVGRKLDRVDIDQFTGHFTSDAPASSLVDALKIAEKTATRLARELGGDELLRAVAEEHVLPATIGRIATNFAPLFRDGVWDGRAEFDVDQFLERGEMTRLHAMVKQGLKADDFRGLQLALNTLVKVPAMVVDQAEPEQTAKTPDPATRQPVRHQPRGFAPVSGPGAGNVSQSWAEGGKGGDISIPNPHPMYPVSGTGGGMSDAVALKMIESHEKMVDKLGEANAETLRAKDELIQFLLQKVQGMGDQLVRVRNVKSGPDQSDSGCQTDDEDHSSVNGSLSGDLDANEAGPWEPRWKPAGNIREEVLNRKGVLEEADRLQGELKVRFAPTSRGLRDDPRNVDIYGRREAQKHVVDLSDTSQEDRGQQAEVSTVSDHRKLEHERREAARFEAALLNRSYYEPREYVAEDKPLALASHENTGNSVAGNQYPPNLRMARKQWATANGSQNQRTESDGDDLERRRLSDQWQALKYGDATSRGSSVTSDLSFTDRQGDQAFMTDVADSHAKSDDDDLELRQLSDQWQALKYGDATSRGSSVASDLSFTDRQGEHAFVTSVADSHAVPVGTFGAWPPEGPVTPAPHQRGYVLGGSLGLAKEIARRANLSSSPINVPSPAPPPPPPVQLVASVGTSANGVASSSPAARRPPARQAPPIETSLPAASQSTERNALLEQIRSGGFKLNKVPPKVESQMH